MKMTHIKIYRAFGLSTGTVYAEGKFVLTMIGEYAYKFTESELDEYFPEIKKFAKRVEE